MKVSVFIALLMVSQLVEAQQKYAPHVDQLNVRDQPTTKNSLILDTLSFGTTVDVIEKQTDSQNQIWYKINQGWIAGWLVSPVTTISNRGIETNDNSLMIEDSQNQVDEPVWGDSSSHDYETLSDSSNEVPAYEPNEPEENQLNMDSLDQDIQSDNNIYTDQSDESSTDFNDQSETEEDHPEELDLEDSSTDNDNLFESSIDF